MCTNYSSIPSWVVEIGTCRVKDKIQKEEKALIRGKKLTWVASAGATSGNGIHALGKRKHVPTLVIDNPYSIRGTVFIKLPRIALPSYTAGMSRHLSPSNSLLIKMRRIKPPPVMSKTLEISPQNSCQLQFNTNKVCCILDQKMLS